MDYRKLTSYYVPSSRPFQVSPSGQVRIVDETRIELKRRRILNDLVKLGVNMHGFTYPEIAQLPRILHDDEHIEGVISGRYSEGFAMLVATSQRVLFVDKKPFFLKADEVTYDSVTGISYERSLFVATITLHTRIGDFDLRTSNFAMARHFTDYIEEKCLEYRLIRKEESYDQTHQAWPI